MSKELLSALSLVRGLLESWHPGEQCNIYLWYDEENPASTVHFLGGPRVAEVSLFTPTTGASWMQYEDDGLLVCAAVERVLVILMNGWTGLDAVEDEGFADDWLRLRRLCKPDLGA